MTPKPMSEKRDSWFLEEVDRAYKCCISCGREFLNSETNIKRGWDAAVTEMQGLQTELRNLLIEKDKTIRALQINADELLEPIEQVVRNQREEITELKAQNEVLAKQHNDDAERLSECYQEIQGLKVQKEELIQFIKSISTRELDSINIVKRASLLHKIEGKNE